MGNNTSNTLLVNQSIQNNFLSVSDQACMTNAQANETNTSLTVTGSKNSTFKAFNITGNMNASCRMTQQITQTASAVLSSQADMVASNSSDWFNGGSIYSSQHNKSTINQSIINNMTSVSVTTCNANASSSINGADIVASYAKGIKVNAYNIKGDINSNCVMSNVVSQKSYSKAASSIKQTAENIGMMVAIFSALFMCISICVIGAVLIFGGGFFLLHATGHDDAIQGIGDSLSDTLSQVGDPSQLDASDLEELEGLEGEGGTFGSALNLAEHELH